MLKRFLAAATLLILPGLLLVAGATPAMAQEDSGAMGGLYGQPYVTPEGQTTNAVYGRHGLEAAHTQLSGKFYVTGSLGGAFPIDMDQRSGDGSLGFDPGPEVHAALGTYAGPFRFEGELGYRENDISSASFGGSDINDASGHLDTFTIMGNGYFDIPVRPNISVYLGAGIGVANEHSTASAPAPGPGDLGGSDWVFAYQLMAGVAFKLNKQLYLNVGYRFWSSLDPKFNNVTFSPPTYHGVEVGIRYNF